MSLSATRYKKSKSAILDDIEQSEFDSEVRGYLQGCFNLPLLTDEDRRKRTFRRWMWNRADVMQEIGVMELRYSDYEADAEEFFFAESLEEIGVDTPAKGNRFVDFYLQVRVPDRSWVSGCQINQKRAANIALTQNYDKLPDWVRQGLMRAPESAKIGGDRIGNIWRLIPCVKAWKWTPQLPKKYAEKIGRCSPRLRMLTGWAWAYSDTHKEFWEILADLDRATLREQISWMFASELENTAYCVGWGRCRWAAFLEQSLGLPHGTINLPARVTQEAVEDAIAQFASPEKACMALLGVAGKCTVKAFQTSDWNRIRWAGAIGDTNADSVQKILQMKDCIAFQPEAIDFLKSLPMISRLRLLAATTFRYRGQENPISDDHIRDTGYLWKNIHRTPDLGLIRCWFSVHEVLAAAFVKELPDEPLPIADDWQRINGLAAIDGSWSIEIPDRVATLKYYGEVLRNCVGGYGPAIKSGRSIVLVVRENGSVTHCIEVCGSYIRQFYRYGNSAADASIESAVCGVLHQAGLIQQ